MGDKSEIQWTDATWNPVTGCSHASEGCDHCYAEALTQRYGKGWGVPQLPWTPENAEQNVILKPERLDQPLRWRRPRMVFVNSMSDLFHPRVPPSYVLRVFDVMDQADRHIFQVLTKRPKRQRDFCRMLRRCRDCKRLKMSVACPTCGACHDEDPAGLPLPNVWCGTSIESRKWVARADLLRATPAAVRFISAEPLLGPLVPPWSPMDRSDRRWSWGDGYDGPGLDLTDIDWLIVGGESGPKHRPIQEEWVRNLRDFCHPVCFTCEGRGGEASRFAGHDPMWHECPTCEGRGWRQRTAFFFKQWGGRTPKSGGRLLDHQEWNEMPATLSPAEEVSPA